MGSEGIRITILFFYLGEMKWLRVTLTDVVRNSWVLDIF